MSDFPGDYGDSLIKIITYDNIAIGVLMAGLVFSCFLNLYLVRQLLKTKDVLQNLTIAITILNERLSHHKHETD